MQEYKERPCIPYTKYLSYIKYNHCTNVEVEGTVIIYAEIEITYFEVLNFFYYSFVCLKSWFICVPILIPEE